MGYRDETEHLRQRVVQLEGTLAALRGERGASRASSFAGKVSRQGLFVAVPAVLVSLLTALFLLATIGVTVQSMGASFEDVFEAGDYEEARFPATPALDRVVRSGGDNYSIPLVPATEDARVLLYCRYRCPHDVEALFRNAEAGILAEPETLFVTGRVQRPRRGHAHIGFSEADLEAYAAANAVELSDLRLVQVKTEGDGVVPMWVITALFALGALAFFGLFFLHRRLAAAEVPYATEADFVTREPVVPLALSLLTCRLYELVWLHQITGQIRRLTGRPDLLPWLDVFLSVATFGVWGYWALYRNAEAIDELMRERGTPTAHRSTVLGLTLGMFVCGILHWMLLYKMQEVANLAANHRPAAPPTPL